MVWQMHIFNLAIGHYSWGWNGLSCWNTDMGTVFSIEWGPFGYQ